MATSLVAVSLLLLGGVVGFAPHVPRSNPSTLSRRSGDHRDYRHTVTTLAQAPARCSRVRRCTMNSEVSDGNSDDGWSLAGGNDSAPAPSDPSSLPSLVEKTFVVAASASDYVGGLKAFIGVVKEAYERGYTVPALTLEVSFVPTQTAGRPLAPDEVELRSVWIALVYLTLEKARWPQKKKRASEISSPFMDRFSVFVDNIMTAFAKGHTLDTLKMEEVMRRGAEPRSPMEAAVLSQSMRIVFTTLELMQQGWSG